MIICLKKKREKGKWEGEYGEGRRVERKLELNVSVVEEGWEEWKEKKKWEEGRMEGMES